MRLRQFPGDRELRKLELEVLRELHHSGQQALDIATIIQVDVDQFHGIEIEEFLVQIAQVALWLTDHQMNALVSEEFDQYFIRLPLKKSAHIVHGNALQLDWNSIIEADECDVVMGNPPFIGAKFMNSEQRADVDAIFHDTKNAGLLDYVACWYRKATDYMAQIPLDPPFSKGEVESDRLNAHMPTPPFAKGGLGGFQRLSSRPIRSRKANKSAYCGRICCGAACICISHTEPFNGAASGTLRHHRFVRSNAKNHL